MAILVDKKTRVLVQGITGNEGSRAAKEMLSYGTRVLAGVTPSKGGQEIHGVPVYDTVKEAKNRHPEINASLIVVPAFAVKDAAIEAISAGVPFIDILTELVSPKDCSEIIAWAKIKGARVIGPASVGVISPGKGKIGSIGSADVDKIFTSGPVGVISKSGGMTSEISLILSRAGIGQSTAIGIGGEQLIGSGFADLLVLFEQDRQTKAVVLFGEVGGGYEEQVAKHIKSKKITKPIVAVIAGKFTNRLPHGTVLGHAGAIVGKGAGSYRSKTRALKSAGVILVDVLEDIPEAVKKLI